MVPKKIEQNMEVVGRDGAHVGIVEQIEGTDEIKLAKDDPDAGGQERYIPLAWLVHTEIKIHLKMRRKRSGVVSAALKTGHLPARPEVR